MTAALVLGSLDLMNPDGPYRIEALGTDSGTTWGNPETIEVELRSLLEYGSLVVTEGISNRVPVIAVSVRGEDMDYTATAEASLMAELYKVNELSYTSASASVPTVFDVLASSLEPVPDDLREKTRAEVIYMIRLVCRPYVRSATEVTVAALAASGSTTTLVDAMSATTNWTGTVNGASVAPATAGGALSVTSSSLSGTVTTTMTRTAAIDTSATKYLVLDWKISAGATLVSFGATADGLTLTKIATAQSPTAGYTRTTFYVAAASVAAVTFTVVTNGGDPDGAAAGGAVRVLTLDILDRSDIRPMLGTARQQVRSIAIAGSAPTTGSMSVGHATNALGDVVLFTCPDDVAHEMYAPPNRNNRVSGSTPVADAAAVSGFYDVIDAATTYDIPVGALPAGEYLVMVRVLRTTAAGVDLVWTYAPRMGGVSLATATSVTTGVTLTTTYGLHRLGMVRLPLWDTSPGGTSVNQFTIITNPIDGLVRLDEFYLYNLTTGRLTQVACGTAAPSAGGTSNRLWIDSPSIDNEGLGRLLRGTAADRSDAFSAYPAAVEPGVHEFKPPGVKVFSMTGNTADASVAFRYHPAAHSRSAS